MTVGGDLVDVIALVVDADGLHPLGLEGGQVAAPEEAAVLLPDGAHEVVDLPGQLPPVEALGLGLADLPEGPGVVRQADDVAGGGALAVLGKGVEDVLVHAAGAARVHKQPDTVPPP